jgi:hypothetical protein
MMANVISRTAQVASQSMLIFAKQGHDWRSAQEPKKVSKEVTAVFSMLFW